MLTLYRSKVLAMTASFLPICLAASASGASAAELKLLTSASMRTVLRDIVPPYEQSSGNRVTIELAAAGVVAERIRKGEAADVVIITRERYDALQRERKIVGSMVPIARVGFGAYVRKGSQKPDISTIDALRRTLLAAKSICYADPAYGGTIGPYMKAILKKLGIEKKINAKTRLMTIPGGGRLAVARGEVEISFSITSEISAPEAAGVDFVGALPDELQHYTVYAAGVVATSKQVDAAKTLIAALASPQAKEAFRSKGFGP